MFRSLALLLFLLPPMYSYGQEKHYCSIDVEYRLAGQLKDILNPFNVRIIVYRVFEGIKNQGTMIDSTEYFADESLYDGKRSIHIDSLEEGEYKINISSREKVNKADDRHILFLFDVHTIHVDSTSKIVTIDYPGPCRYREHVIDKICPKCKKSDAAIPILYGFPMVDFESPEQLAIGRVYLYGCDVPDCAPYWYCERDEEQF